MMALEPLIDSFGRLVGDLRISVIDRCNFRCTYCMPAEGLPWLRTQELLCVDEISRLAALFVRLGVHEIKLTGGEPTARRGVVDIVGPPPGPRSGIDLLFTTNGPRPA